MNLEGIVSKAGHDKSSSADITDWHRLFGIILTEHFEGSAWEVVTEVDLSIKQQLLDIVIARRRRGHKTPVLPDGLGPLADYNLLTYKSLREPLDGWALKELAGHSVNYRKQRSPSLNDLMPEESIRLFAIATRFPEKLAGQIPLQQRELGVYDVEELLKKYLGEPDMPQTLAELIRDSQNRVIADIPPSCIVEQWSLEKLRETQALIAKRLAASEQQKPAMPRAIKGRRKTGATNR